ncbi:SAM-DEPENDENT METHYLTRANSFERASE [Salix purpurea]|uniref:Methyltransferase n=1 Tax=Salix purpurea TaxID=77065 RepID=A0A9Q0PBN3_SALPP|nr:SAM-DEPENDENT METHYLTRANSFERASE [Salix purpurea]
MNLRNLTGGRGETSTKEDGKLTRVKYERFRVCEESTKDYIPCLDNVEEIKRLNLSGGLVIYERHCPEEGKGLDCLVPMPKGYKKSIPWPRSRDEVWFSNVPHARLVEDKGGQNWIALKKDKFVFPGGGTQFIHGADQYLNQISEMVPEIAFGQHTRIALDIGCGVASFGAFLLQPVFSTRRLLYPSQAFDLIHCSRCRIDWTRDDGILLLEVNRMLRAGGYFIWAAQPVYKHDENLQEKWKEMQDLTRRICWEFVKKEGYIAIWRKPLNNSCYLSRDSGAQPPLCDSNDDPDSVWYVSLRPCMPRLPENGYGANVTTWPERLHYPPDRLQSIRMDATFSRKELFKAESKYWNEIIESYVRAFHWKQMDFRNVMDMRAGFGGYCSGEGVALASSLSLKSETVPISYLDQCETFDTYPRTYDLLHAAGLFSAEQRRHKCKISSIMLEMDRMLRPGGTVYIRDSISVMSELQEIATAMRWVCALRDTGEGPHASWKILTCDKRIP